MRTVVLVEGESDRIAVETLAARRGRDLASEGVSVIAVGGAHALQRVLSTLETERVAGLYDRAEETAILRALEALDLDRVPPPLDGVLASSA